MSNNTQSTTEATSVSLSDNAAKRIAFLLTKEPEKALLRVAVDGGGCAGFQYKFEFISPEDVTKEDLILQNGEAQVAIDDISLDLMQNSIIDFVDTLGASHFEIKNPQAATSCGCGNSFSV